MTVGTYDLTTIANAKTALGITVSTYDSQLQLLVTAASAAISAKLGVDFIKRTYAEPHLYGELDGEIITVQPPSNFIVGGSGSMFLKLWHRPIFSVTSIADPAGNTITKYVMHKTRGILEGIFSVPVDSNGLEAYWTVTYVAGNYANTAALIDTATGNPDVEVACILTVGEWFGRDKGQAVSSKTISELSITYAKDVETSKRAIPDVALDLLTPYINVSV